MRIRTDTNGVVFIATDDMHRGTGRTDMALRMALLFEEMQE